MSDDVKQLSPEDADRLAGLVPEIPRMVAFCMHKGADRETALDAAQSVIEKTLLLLVRGHEISNLRAYVQTAMVHESHRSMRARLVAVQDSSLVADSPSEGVINQRLVMTDADVVRAVFDERATQEDVRNAMREIATSGDKSMYRVLTCMFNSIQRTGEVPSNRQIAKEVGLSHTGVAKTLKRMQEYFETAKLNLRSRDESQVY